MRAIYGRYHTEKDFSPFAHQGTVDALATPALAALFKRDQQTSHAAQDESETGTPTRSAAARTRKVLQLVDLKVPDTRTGAGRGPRRR